MSPSSPGSRRHSAAEGRFEHRRPAGLSDTLRAASLVKDRAIDRAAYAADASHYLMTPAAVVLAENTVEVASILRRAANNHTPLTFRSGGTSLSGQASTEGILVDVRRHFRGIEVLDDGARVRVQPGATLAQVNARLASRGVRLGPDPASEVACTIGGIIANNSSGMACGVDHNTYRTLESMTFVLPSGTVIDTAAGDANQTLREHEPTLVSGLERIRDRIRAHPGWVSLIRRQFSLKNTMGYGINAFLDFDTPAEILAHLIIGSEGTLAFVAEAVFTTVPVPRLASTALAVLPSLETATDLLPELAVSGAVALELMDTTSLRVGQSLPGTPDEIQGFAPSAEAALLIEYRADGEDELEALTAQGRSLLRDTDLTRAARFSAEGSRRSQAWAFRKGLYAAVAGARPSGTTALLEDVVVPAPALSETCRSLQALFDHYSYTNSVIFGHAKDGNIHFMLTDRFEGDSALSRYLGFTEEMVDVILSSGGNLKAEHGTGRAMAPYVRRQYGDGLYEIMQHLKSLCDPAGIMNPGVILDEDPDAHIRHIKLSPPVESEVDRCVECGYCEPVCPSRDLTLTPRQRIVTRRAIETARRDGDHRLVARLEKDYEYSGLQTCAADGMCQTACPVLIDTGSLVKRLRLEQASSAKDRAWQAAAKAWGPATRAGATALSLAQRIPPPLVRGLTDLPRTILGPIKGPETVPRYSAELPRGGNARGPLSGHVGDPEAKPSLVYVPACVNSLFGPAGSERTAHPAASDAGPSSGVSGAFINLLRAAGMAAIVPQGVESLCCGTPWSSKGMASGYEHTRERSVHRIAETASSELPVVIDASSCTEGFAEMLAEDERTEGLVVMDAVAYVARNMVEHLTVATKMDSLVLHPTCSSHRMGLDEDLQRVAAQIAETVRIPEDWGCCAFAGDRGMLHPELTAAATAPEAAQVQAITADAHASCNRTCELGMTRATGQRYAHVLEHLWESL